MTTDVIEMRAMAGELLEASRNLLAAAQQLEDRESGGHVGIRRMAEDAGLVSKPFYSLSELAKATGIPRSTLDEERKSGRLESFIPYGNERGILVKCEWFDKWMAEDVRSGARARKERA